VATIEGAEEIWRAISTGGFEQLSIAVVVIKAGGHCSLAIMIEQALAKHRLLSFCRFLGHKMA